MSKYLPNPVLFNLCHGAVSYTSSLVVKVSYEKPVPNLSHFTCHKQNG